MTFKDRQLNSVTFQTSKEKFLNRPFYRYGGHIELIGFNEYYGMPRAHSLSIYARFSGKKRTSMYISLEKAIVITSKHGTTIFFSHYNLFLGKL